MVFSPPGEKYIHKESLGTCPIPLGPQGVLMSDSEDASGFVPGYQEARITHWAYGQRQPRFVQDELRRLCKIEVPLALIRQLWLNPHLQEYRMNSTDIIRSFSLFRLLVLEIRAVRRALEEAQIRTADGAPATWLRSYVVALLLNSNDSGIEVNWISPELLTPAYLKAAAQLSYMMELKPSKPSQTRVEA
jgi:hypothetical protein